MRFSDKLTSKLISAGWVEGCSSSDGLRSYESVIGDMMHPAARIVLDEFDELIVGRRVFFGLDYVKLALEDFDAIPASLRAGMCPVAETTYWSDASVWIDDHGCVFLLETYQFCYLSSSFDAALEILVLSGDPEEPPESLQPGIWVSPKSPDSSGMPSEN